MKKNTLQMRFLLRIFVLAVLIVLNLVSFGQDYVLSLYKGEIPNSKKTGQKEKIEKSDITLISNVQDPDIAVYLPSKRFATGQAVVIGRAHV